VISCIAASSLCGGASASIPASTCKAMGKLFAFALMVAVWTLALLVEGGVFAP